MTSRENPMPLTVEQALRQAKRHAKKSEITQATAHYKNILARFPGNKRAQAGLATLQRSQASRTSTKAATSETRINELLSLYNQKQFEDVLRQGEALAIQFPKEPLVPNIIGAALQALGKPSKAIVSYDKAISIKPDYAEAFSNRGVVLQELNRLDEAVASYDKAISIKPDYAEAVYNRGVALQELNRLDEAVASYDKAISIKPDYAEAYTNRGNTLKGLNRLDEAVASYIKALKINPGYADAYYNMGEALRNTVFTKPTPGLTKIILKLLDMGTYVRPSSIVKATISLLKFDPIIIAVLKKHSAGGMKQSFEQTISELFKVPLLLKLMSVCPLPDIELEAVLTNIRSCFLLSIPELSGNTARLAFQSALALQCFTNEYVYNQTDTETEALQTLEADVENMLSDGHQPDPSVIACLASYRALHEYTWHHLLSMPAELETLERRQIVEFREEKRLRTEMPLLQEITDDISSKVRNQYEENPYPRWVNLRLLPKSASISEIVKELNLKRADNSAKGVDAPQILIAGCGTGQHSIETASRFQDCRVLAVDLSSNSLAYANRKTEELGIKNIEYLQADILDLGKLDRQFDIIESVGVLHHMDDPMAGWRVLTDRLKPGGLMKIGLYSELARKPIINIRAIIEATGLKCEQKDMIAFRAEIKEGKHPNVSEVMSWQDFYSLSGFRDLAFHVQEHRFTLPQIRDCLTKLGLEFCGLEENQIVQNFKLKNFDPDDPYDLTKWHAFEEHNPNIFAGMYQFWCQKVN